MILCLCNGISETDVKKQFQKGKNPEEIMQKFKIGKSCGSCICQFQELIEEEEGNKLESRGNDAKTKKEFR